MTEIDMINMNLERYVFQREFMKAGNLLNKMAKMAGEEPPEITDWKPAWPHIQWVTFS